MGLAEELEPDPATGGPPAPGRVSEELRGTPPPLAPPLLRGLHEPRALKRAPEARLVEPTSEQQLVHRLELAQRECRREKTKGDRRLVETLANPLVCGVDDCALPRSEGWKVRHRKPGGDATDRRRDSHRDQADVPDGEIDVRGVPAAIAEGPDLLEPARRAAERGASQTISRDLERLIGPEQVVRKAPLFPCARIGGAIEEDRQLFAVRRQQNEVDREPGATDRRFRRSGGRAVAHDARISHQKSLMSSAGPEISDSAILYRPFGSRRDYIASPERDVNAQNSCTPERRRSRRDDRSASATQTRAEWSDGRNC